MNFEERRRVAEFFKILIKVDKRETARKERLLAELEGFAVEGQYTCRQCGYDTNRGWYTEHGILCPPCLKK